MQIKDVVLGLAAGVGIDLSPDGKKAYYVEWSIGELSRVEVDTGVVMRIAAGLSYPEDVEVDWQAQEIFVSERTGAVVRIWPGEKRSTIARPGGAPQQLALVKKGAKRFLYTVCYDSGRLVRIDVATQQIKVIAVGLGHPVGLAIDSAHKYAYVTEQDSGALTRIELLTATAQRLYTGLVAPFFLAWDKNAMGLFCVQRDPANSLVRLNLRPPSTVTTVASGLAWRPSGVAPNADNQLIYICADRELEVICFDGGPTIKSPKPPFAIHSIQFNYDQSKAIGLKDHLTGAAVPLPEYVRNVRSGPAAYVVGTLPHIKVVLRKLPAFVNGAYLIGATGSLGGVRRKTVTPVFNPLGFSQPIDFELMWPLPGTVGKPDVTLGWYARKSPGPSIPVSVGSTVHRVYLLMATPTQPWMTEILWVAALELACGWAAGAATVDAVATRITERYHNCGRVSYDTVQGATKYHFNNYAGFYLSEMIERLNGGVGLGEKVNCTDSANTVSTLSNLLGCDLWQSRMGSSFYMNPIRAIGCTAWERPFWGGFGYHEVAWKGACTENDKLFDGCLCVDGDADPTTAPHQPLLPTNMLFGDCTIMNYRLRLCPATSNGCSLCKPQPATKQKRPVK